MSKTMWIGGSIAGALLVFVFAFFVALPLVIGTGFHLWDRSHIEQQDTPKIPPLTGSTPQNNARPKKDS